MENKNRQLAAILFADIVDYTALMQINEKQALANLHKDTESQYFSFESEKVYLKGNQLEAGHFAKQRFLLDPSDIVATILQAKVNYHKGQIINNYGDGYVCTFNSAVDAIRKCAPTRKSRTDNSPIDSLTTNPGIIL